MQLPATTISVRPKTTVTGAVAGTPNVRAIAPNTPITVRQQIRPAGTPTTPASTPNPVQNLRIIQGPNGQIQVQGLMAGKYKDLEFLDRCHFL